MTDSRQINRRRLLMATAAAPGIAMLPAAQGAIQDAKREVQRYERLGRTELEISDISFGASMLRDGQEHLVEHALDRGINYFDTAEGYTRGASERVIGNALRGKRDRVFIASKTFTSATTRQQDMMQDLDASLERLQTDYVDVYFTHAVNDVARLANPEWGEFIERARSAGKIRFSGLSGHAGRLVECIDYALAQDMIDVMLVAYNFGQDPAFYENITRSFDFVATQPELPRVLARAKALDVGVIAMKTLMGGRLNDMRPYERADGTYAQAAFRWVLKDSNVDALIISMRSTEAIDEYLGASGDRQIDADDVALLERYAKLNGATYCRNVCNSCEDACPLGVPIADVLRTRMYAVDYQDLEFGRREYAALEPNAEACLTCNGAPCAGACPSGIDIAQFARRTHNMLG